MKQYLEIGKIVNVHGLRGTVKVVPWCDDPEFLCEFETLYLGKEYRPVIVTDARLQKGNVLLRLEGVETVEQAEKLRGQILYMNRDAVELEEGVYFIQDLMGLQIVDADSGKVYGKLTEVFQTGANDVYEVKAENGTAVLIPAIPDVIAVRCALILQRCFRRCVKPFCLRAFWDGRRKTAASRCSAGIFGIIPWTSTAG